MVNKINSVQIDGWHGEIQSVDEVVMKQFYQELTESLADIKNNILECIHHLENTIHLNSSLIDTMENSIKSIEHAKKLFYAMRNFNLNST